ncbi:MAG: carbamoyltransferase HypF, partial [Syntrophomonadaceae bacterium]
LGHLKYVPLPGGDLSARKPYRMALVYLLESLGEAGAAVAERLLPDLAGMEMDIMFDRWSKGIPEIQTSSCGRIFDAAAAVLGICTVNNYEGQAAIELEAMADRYGQNRYGYRLEKTDSGLIMDAMPMWGEMLQDMEGGRPKGLISRKFHLTMVDLFTAALIQARDEAGLNKVVLSGGVFHNQIILLELTLKLLALDFEVYQHQLIPPGDGGIALGQAIIASEVQI